MRTRNLGQIVSLLFVFTLLVCLSGCSNSPAVTSVVTPTVIPGTSLVEISIDWSELNESNAIGARLVCPKENAVNMQSVYRKGASGQGVLTLVAPATSWAHLYLVAVDLEEQTAFSYAVAKNLRLEGDSVFSMTHDDFQWIEATWVVEDDSGDSWIVRVRDPFQEDKQASYETSLIDCCGVSSMGENIDGWLHFEADVSGGYLQPCVDGSHFNLGNKGFHIPPVLGKIKVVWE